MLLSNIVIWCKKKFFINSYSIFLFSKTVQNGNFLNWNPQNGGRKQPFLNSYSIFLFFLKQHSIELNWTETPKIGDGKVYPPPCFSSTDTGLDSKLQISYIRMCRKNARRAHKNANNISPVHIRNRKPAFETIRKSIRIDYEHICVKISPILTLFCRVRVRVIWALLSPSFAYIQCLNWSFNAWHSIF